MGTFGKGDRYFDATVRMFSWMIDQASDPQSPESMHQPFQEDHNTFNARLEAFWESIQR